MTDPNGADRTYTCGNCGKTFEKGWSDEEARAEYQQNFPETQGHPEALVCDDCYRAIREWWKNL